MILRDELRRLPTAIRQGAAIQVVADELAILSANILDGAFVGTYQDLAIRLVALGRRLTDVVERHPADPHQNIDTTALAGALTQEPRP